MFSDGPKYAYKHLTDSANPVCLGIDRRQIAGNAFLLQLCKFIATCLAEKVKNSAEDWQ